MLRGSVTQALRSATAREQAITSIPSLPANCRSGLTRGGGVTRSSSQGSGTGRSGSTCVRPTSPPAATSNPGSALRTSSSYRTMRGTLRSTANSTRRSVVACCITSISRASFSIYSRRSPGAFSFCKRIFPKARTRRLGSVHADCAAQSRASCRFGTRRRQLIVFRGWSKTKASLDVGSQSFGMSERIAIARIVAGRPGTTVNRFGSSGSI